MQTTSPHALDPLPSYVFLLLLTSKLSAALTLVDLSQVSKPLDILVFYDDISGLIKAVKQLENADMP